jgi:ribokinase
VPEPPADPPPARSGRIAVVGSVNLDLVVGTPRIPGPGETVLGTSYREFAGGKGLNQAVAAARQGAVVRLVGALGDDAAGEMLAEAARREGIDVAGVQRLPDEPTGRALITVDERAENSIIVVPGANAHVSPDLVGWSEPVDLILSQCEIPVPSVARAMRAGRGSAAITALNPSPAVELDEALLADVDLLVPNEHEVELIGGVDTLIQQGVGAVVVTRGAAGIEVTIGPSWCRRVETSERPRTFRQEPFGVVPVDTTGAGDACCGALVAAVSRGVPLVEAVRRAAVAGALATTCAGAVPSLPTAAAVDDLLDGRPQS